MIGGFSEALADGTATGEDAGRAAAAIREETARSTLWKDAKEVITRVNRKVRGWISYFHYANSSQVFAKMQWQVRERVRRWLWKKQAKSKGRRGEAYSNEQLHHHYGLATFPMHAPWRTS